MLSHKNPKVNDEFETWLNEKHGNLGQVKTARGDEHDYLGMTFNFPKDGEVDTDMKNHAENMTEEFPMKLKSTDAARTPATESLFNEGQGKKLEKKRAEECHMTVAKGSFTSKRARPDAHPTTAVPCTRVKNLNEADWNKLMRPLKHLDGTRNMKLTLSAGDS